MTTLDLATQLVQLCREGKNLDAIDRFYSPDVVSVEAKSMANMPRQYDGLKAVRDKSVWWIQNHTVHACEIKGPYLHGDDRFACHFHYDVTIIALGQRMQMDEVGVYTVKNGKIVREEFYYTM